jgi:hypothetical protein
MEREPECPENPPSQFTVFEFQTLRFSSIGPELNSRVAHHTIYAEFFAGKNSVLEYCFIFLFSIISCEKNLYKTRVSCIYPCVKLTHRVFQNAS